MQRQNEPFNRGNGGPGGPGGAGGPGGRAFGGPRSVMPIVKAKDFKGTLIKLWRHFGSERKSLTVVLFMVLGSSVLTLIAPYLIGRSIDVISAETGYLDFSLLGVMILALLISYFIEAALAFLQGWAIAGVSHRIVQNMRRILFGKLQRLPVSFFDLRTHGELMSRLSNDMENISSTISQATTQLFTSVFMVSGSLIMMLILSPLLTLASVITIPLVFIVTKSVAKRTRVLFKEQQVLLGKLNGHIEETISGIQIIKAFNHEDKAIVEFKEINSKLNKVGVKAQVWSGFIMPLMNVINNLGFAVVAGAGGVLAVKDIISIGIIASFLSYSRQFARPLNEIANIFNVLQSAVAGAERVFEILEEPEESEDSKDAYELRVPKGNVIFDDVSFGYRANVSVLEHVSFEAKAGSTIALVGPTGAGKTTIVNLLARFYEVTSGRILIDGIDIRDYTRDSLRKCFGIVLQDTYLFSGTIKENIRYGKLDASDEEVQAAAVMANADVFIRRLPQGYDTVLAENGSNLSQGQRQLLAIARAILANPSILILDEATSNVDTRTELHIQEAMLKLMKNRTSFIIAHRLSTIRDADIIMVIDKGRIVEKGRHEELLKSGGVYSNMYFGQLRRTEIV